MNQQHYRLLNEGEEIKNGDEEWDAEDCFWDQPLKVYIGTNADGITPFRRPLGSDACDHLVGRSSWPFEGECVWKKSDRRMDEMHEVFTFCPLCGKPLTKEDRE